MKRIQNNVVKNISKCNLLHDIFNPPKCAKKIKSHDSPILYGCINTRKGKVRFKSFAYYWTVYVVLRF